MKKTFFLFFLITVILLFCSSCDVINGIIGGDGGDNTVCEHEWVEATCQSPRKCIKCDATFGGIGNHKYSEATCTLPEVCEFCGIWYGLAIGHDYSVATCTNPRTCKTCGHESGSPVHNYTEATCTEPKTCTLCGGIDGVALGHKLETVITAESCSADGKEEILCTVCQEVIESKILPMVLHSELPFTYNGDATTTKDGTVSAVCPYCDYSVTETLEGSSALLVAAFSGKKISILGDSISTYLDFSSGIAADTTNSTIRNNLVWGGYQPGNLTFGGESVDSTWWQTVINSLGASCLVNNSNSGESVFEAVKGRCMQLHDDTGENAGEEPDIIFVYLGTNDVYAATMGNAATLTQEKIARMGDNLNYQPKSLAEAYAIMLYRIQKTYPNAEIYCLTNLERSDVKAELTHSVCKVIRDVVALFDGIYLADIALESGIELDNPDYLTYMPKDGGNKSIHPGVEGMKEIARVLLASISENSRYVAEDFEKLLLQYNVSD